jgi:hypothetical protein
MPFALIDCRTYEGSPSPVASPVAENAGLHLSAKVIEDVPYRDVTKPATSRALIPAGQPYDSRVQAALAQHTAARARAPVEQVDRLLFPKDLTA